jgi:hypothetical protein
MVRCGFILNLKLLLFYLQRDEKNVVNGKCIVQPIAILMCFEMSAQNTTIATGANGSSAAGLVSFIVGQIDYMQISSL